MSSKRKWSVIKRDPVTNQILSLQCKDWIVSKFNGEGNGQWRGFYKDEKYGVFDTDDNDEVNARCDAHEKMLKEALKQVATGSKHGK